MNQVGKNIRRIRKKTAATQTKIQAAPFTVAQTGLIIIREVNSHGTIAKNKFQYNKRRICCA